MHASPADPAAPPPGTPVAVGRTQHRRQARDWGLVLTAAGIPHQVQQQGGGALFVVTAELAERAARELAAYEDENRGWPRVEELPEVLTQGSLGVVLWTVVLLLVDQLTGFGAGGLDWRAAGRSAAGLVREGEWWRAVTALTLHADLYHLLGNIVFGALFVGLACQVLGTGLALLTVVASGALGNLANAWIQGPLHASIGASTAVFGALGVLVGHRVLHRPRTARGRSLRWLPLLAGVFLLGYLGMGGSPDDPGARRIDVGAHALGFAAGALLGALHGRQSGWRPGPRQQIALGAAAGLLLALCWALALR